jgi:hypothetical protein
METRLFDEKTAKEPQFAYDGASNGGTWRSDVWDYMISRCPSAEPWLKWAEQQGAVEITSGVLTAKAMSGDLMTELSPFVLSHHMWGFFHHGLREEARQVFKLERRHDGFNVWRLVLLEVNSQTD